MTSAYVKLSEGEQKHRATKSQQTPTEVAREEKRQKRGSRPHERTHRWRHTANHEEDRVAGDKEGTRHV